MPILVYSGFGTSNMLTADRNLGSITTGIDKFVLTYSLCPLLTRTVPRLLREKKTHDQHFERGQPNCHALRLFLFLFLFFYIFYLESSFGQDAPGVQKSQLLVP